MQITELDVDFAYDGVARLDAARRLGPDVVFLDLARRMRDDPRLRDAQTIAVTGSAGEADWQRARGRIRSSPGETRRSRLHRKPAPPCDIGETPVGRG
jgi:CheY-like chemotaxis protein